MHIVFKLPKPKKAFGLVRLGTAVELIICAAIINRISGFYGMLSIFTGANMTAWQLSLYIYSIISLVWCCYSLIGVKKVWNK